MRLLTRAAALAGCAMLAGCAAEYLDRRESISFGAGDAQQANLITHVVSPLPSHAADPHLTLDGERMGDAVERYRTGATAAPAPVTPATTAVPVGAPAQ